MLWIQSLESFSFCLGIELHQLGILLLEAVMVELDLVEAICGVHRFLNRLASKLTIDRLQYVSQMS